MIVRRFGLTVAALLVSLLLCAKLVLVLLAPAKHWLAADVAARPGGRQAAPAPNIIFPPRREFAETLARPLFSPSRQPAPPAAAVGDVAAPPPLVNITLVGTILGPQVKVAVLRGASGPAQRVTLGQMIGGWQVTGIEKDRVLLRAGTAEQEILVPRPSQNSGVVSRQSSRPPPLPR